MTRADLPRTLETPEGFATVSSRSQYETPGDPLSTLTDNDWVSAAFLTPGAELTPEDDANRYWSSAEMKFTDSSIGGNIGINPRPQYCQYSDPPVKGRISDRPDPSLSDTTGQYGLGRLYSEMHDDAAQRIYLVHGVPQFNTLFGFLTNAYHAAQISLVRSGRSSQAFYNAGKWATAAVAIYAFPLRATAFILGTLVLKKAFSRPLSKFYTLKPTMHLYWNAVNQLVIAMMVNRGIMPKFLRPDLNQEIGRAYYLDNEYLELLNSLLPDVFVRDPSGLMRIDMIGLITRTQRLQNAVIQQEFDALNQGSTELSANPNNPLVGYVKRTMTGQGNLSSPLTKADGSIRGSAKLDVSLSVTRILDRIFGQDEGQSPFSAMVETTIPSDNTQNPQENTGTLEIAPDAQVDSESNPESRSQGNTSASIAEYTDALLRDGALFSVYIVDHVSSYTESWSNSAAESELSKKLNQAVTDVSEARFAAADGNLVNLGGIGDFLKNLGSAALGAAAFISADLTEVIRGLAGSGYIDIPQHWNNSTMDLAGANYTLTLVSPYGNPFSQLLNIDIPMAMLMAAALPRSIGSSAYTAPFLTQLYDRGRVKIQLGMIRQLSFERGVTNLGFNDSGNAMAVKVSFSILDLSTIMHMPVVSGSYGPDFNLVDDGNSTLSDYLAVLGGLSIDQQIYFLPRQRLVRAKQLLNASSFFSPANVAMTLTNNSVADLLKLLTRGSATLDTRGTNNL